MKGAVGRGSAPLKKLGQEFETHKTTMVVIRLRKVYVNLQKNYLPLATVQVLEYLRRFGIVQGSQHEPIGGIKFQIEVFSNFARANKRRAKRM